MSVIKNFLRRLGETRFMIFCLVVLSAFSYCQNGWLGLLGVALGICVGELICRKLLFNRYLRGFG